MPRISPSLIRHAYKESPLLHYLLPACRTLDSARQELRWIKAELPASKWLEACVDRSKFVPLQYVLGSQPFGSLEIGCRKGVLIPRWETEEWCVKLVGCLKELVDDGVKKNVEDEDAGVRRDGKLKVLDVCTGTGCIPLLIAKELGGANCDVKGLDVSDLAIDLAMENAKSNGLNVEFVKGDVFKVHQRLDKDVDLIVSNPPYIPVDDYQSSEMEKSVRLYEPKLALVGDLEFYEALVKNYVLELNANGFLFELGYEKQFDITKSLLDEKIWECWLYRDSVGKPRVVVGYKRGTNMEVLKSLR